MKKSTIIIASVIGAIVLSSTAFADEILFRNVPWGSTMDEVEKAIPADMYWHNDEDDLRADPAIFYEEGDEFSFKYDAATAGTLASMYIFSDCPKVANYEPAEIGMHFVRMPVDGVVTYDDHSNTSMYSAYYLIEPESVEGATEDLIGKLKSVYGEPDSSDEFVDTVFDTSIKLLVWRGDNDTFVSLRSVASTEKTSKYTNSDFIRISYGTYQGDKWIEESEKAILGMEQSNYGSSNTDGL